MSDDIVGNMEESHTNHKNDDVKNEKEDDDYGGNSPTQQDKELDQVCQASVKSKLQLVKNGMCVKCEGVRRYFDYCIEAKSAQLKDNQINNWTEINRKELPGDHMRCVWLSEAYVPSLLASISDTSATVVVVINNINSFQVDDCVYEHCSLPVVVLNLTSGQILSDMLDKDFEAQLHAIISRTSMQVEHEDIRTPDEHRMPEQKPMKNSKSFFDRITGWLSESAVPIKVTDDCLRFTSIMSEFQEYEQCQGQDAKEIKKVLKLLMKQITQVFHRDFPFYFCIAGRIIIAERLYRDVKPEKFITACCNNFETLCSDLVAETLKTFLSRFESVPDMKYYLRYFAHAIEIIGNQRCSDSDTNIYALMLWPSVLLKLNLAQNRGTHPEEIWKMYIRKMSHACDKNIHEFIEGKSVGEKLELPTSFQFSCKCLLDVMTPEHAKQFPTFHEQKNALTLLPDDTSEEEFIDYVKALLNYYASLVMWKFESPILKQVTGTSNNAAAIAEGIELVKFYQDFLLTRGWNHEKFPLGSWLHFLATIINFRNHPGECVHTLFDRSSEILTTDDTDLITFVTEATERKLKSMNIDQFNEILQSCNIWERTLVTKYFQEYQIHSLKLKDCQPLLSTLIQRQNLVPDCKYVWKFFMKLAHQLYSTNPAYFLWNLLQLKLPQLLNTSVNTLTEEELETDIRHYIKKDNNIPPRLLHLIKADLKHITEERDDLHMVLLSAIRKETVTFPKKKLVCSTVKVMANHLTGSTSWADKAPDQRELFCLDFITSYLDSVPVVNESFSWLSRFIDDEAVCSVLKVYSHFIVKANCQTPMTQIPDYIQDNESQSVKKLFLWILKIESFLMIWRKRFADKLVTYDHIQLYLQNIKVMYDISVHLKVEHLVFQHEEVIVVGNEYESDFQELNSLLLKQVSTDGQGRTCSVQSVLINFNLQFPEVVQEKLRKYVRLPTDSLQKDWISLKHLLPKGEVQCIQLSQDLNLADLSKMVCDLKAFLKPLLCNLDIVAFFHERPKAVMFNTYLINNVRMEHEKAELRITRDETCDVNHYLLAFSDALQATISLVKRIISGEATYGESVIDHQLDLSKLDVDAEFSALSECLKLAIDNNPDQRALKCMFKLVQFEAKYYDTIIKVCKQYHLHGCVNDPKLQEVEEIISTVRNKDAFHQLTMAASQEKWLHLEEILNIKGKNMDCLKLFVKITDYADLYHFMKERNFVGPSCAEVFRSQFRLITQHDMANHDSMVMDHLYSSISFIAPFLDETQTFEKLMTSVSTLDTTNGLSQLDTVKSNMHLIHYWFSKSQDSVENSVLELDCIWSNGKYCFEITEEVLLLKFQQSQLMVESGSDSKSTYTDSKSIVWKEEQVKDFIHKLGFLECNEEQKEKLDTFMSVTETARKVMKIFVDLRDKGHPDYFMANPDTIEDLSCSCDTLQLNEKRLRAQQKLNDWKETVQTLHSKYKWLLFFRIPKLMQLCKYLDSSMIFDNSLLHCVLQEIQFLLQGRACDHPEDIILKDIKDAFGRTLQESCSHLKIERIGLFLKIFTDNGYCVKSPRHSVSKSDILYSASNFSQGQIIQLVLSVYQRPPEPFEYLRCCPTTSEEELKIFMKRVFEHPRMYIILHVNSLPHFLQEVLLNEYLDLKQRTTSANLFTNVHFVETAPSVLREIPWLKLTPLEDEVPSLPNVPKYPALESVELVYGHPGDGKTHYIREKLLECSDSSCQCTIVINEAFSVKNVIERLRKLPRKDCKVHFNITSLLTRVTKKEGVLNLADEIGWLFFDLLLLGYIEHPPTGLSFSFPYGTSWNIYIEVPCRGSDSEISAEINLQEFMNEFPVSALVGTPKLIDSAQPFKVDEGVQLVCKYLKRFDTDNIDVTFRALSDYDDDGIKFSKDKNLSDEECHTLLTKYMNKHNIRNNKTDQKLFVSYMKRRCTFLDNLPGFNFNPGKGFVYRGDRLIFKDTTNLGSTLMGSMLKEVQHFCDPLQVSNWTKDPHQQLIYDIDAEGGGAIGLISLNPEQLPEADRKKYVALEVEIPSMQELYERTTLDIWLSRALGLKFPNSEKRLRIIDDSNYVLTLDYTLKMLNIHERRECGIPVIVQGETGVGKTALIEMLSKLWNNSWHNQWERRKSSMLLDNVMKKLEGLKPEEVESFEDVCEVIHTINSHKPVSKEQILQIVTLQDEEGLFNRNLIRSLLDFKTDPIFSMLDVDLTEIKAMLSSVETDGSPEVTAELMKILLNAKVKSVFYKLNIHAALLPIDIHKFFSQVCSHANDLIDAYSGTAQGNLSVPSITVYLDEINTSSYLGILKEIITDRTIEGEPLPDNIFIIAACNPFRADSLAIYREAVSETWLKAAYCVQRLHPSLRQLIWDYGALNPTQEKQYITAKMDLLNKSLSPAECDSLNCLIVESQEKMREYALAHISSLGRLQPNEAMLCSRSCVSQRDIQRVFTFYTWLIQLYKQCNPHQESESLFHRRAVMVALGLVYYMRLNTMYRENYCNLLNTSDKLVGEVTFSEAYEAELQWLLDQLQLPSGIAKTIAIKENVFAITVCTMTRTPLIIVGDPGTSKTISFNIVTANLNLKGKESKTELFSNTEVFKSLDPHFYQCSKRTTSKEIEKVFTKAINQQQNLAKVPLPVRSVVLMDEAGLPESDMESLKALHYYLDEQQVSFVAISNHVLDAAKTNRAVSLFRPKATFEELKELGLASIETGKYSAAENYEVLIEALVKAYSVISDEKQRDNIQSTFRNIFGLRDFIFLVTYLRRKTSFSKSSLSLQMIVEGLERNFNGTDQFVQLCNVFLKHCSGGRTIDSEPHFRSILHVMRESLEDSSMKKTSSIHSSVQSEVRHMLIIDCSEDSSVIRLVFQRGILHCHQLRFYVCGDFPGDVHASSSETRVSTIAQIRHSVAAGHTVLMCQTEQIHECFFDLFNQRYDVIYDPNSETHHYYANIAIGAHSKLCKVHPDFRCIVVIREADLPRTSLPFLNRFEKYRVSHDVLYRKVLDSTPQFAQLLIKTVYKKVQQFAEDISDYLYGFSEDTLKSLMLSILPSEGYVYKPHPFDTEPDQTKSPEDISSLLLRKITHAMHLSAGFNINVYAAGSKELELDTRHLFQLLKRDPEHVHLNQLEHHKVPGLIDEALNLLYYHKHQDEPISVYSDACMVISLVFHWLVVYACKRLMQLMIAEALPSVQNFIPTYYIEHYLLFQHHFSLKKLISKTLCDIEQTNGIVSAPTKLMCFTRSSPLIRQLPTEFHCHGSTPHHTDFLQKYLCDDVESFVLCKLSSRHSQTNLEDIIKNFTASSHKVLMFIVDAGTNIYQQEVKRLKENISHLRMMIEEAEVHSSSDHAKVYVMLIHFPPARLLTKKEPCYPALFLQGWDHFYLDTIADGTLTRSGTMASVVNVEQWLYSCLVKPTIKDLNLRCDEMEDNVEDILRDALPSVASRLNLRSKESGYQNFLDVSRKTAALKYILLNNESGKEHPGLTQSYAELKCCVGAVLARSFSKYWNSREMNRYLQKFTSLTFLRKSTLNLTASVETTFRSLFADFLVYRLSRMEVTLDIYVYDESSPSCLVKCLLYFLEHLPLPRLEQLSQLSDLPIVKLFPPPKHIPKFPFLSEILKSINMIIEEADDKIKLEFCKELAPGVEVTEGSIRQMTTNERITKCFTIVKEKVSKLLDEFKNTPTILGKFLQLLQLYPDLWEHYFQEVVTTKLDPHETLSQKSIILISYIGPFRSLIKNCVHQFIDFHVHLHVHHLDILEIQRALKPIAFFTSDPTELICTMQGVEHKSEFSAYIVNKIFDFVCNMNSSQMKHWLHCFHKVLSIRSFVEDVLSIPTDCSDMKFILMYTSYLIGSAEDLDELCTAAHRFLLNMKDFSSSMNQNSRTLQIMAEEAINAIEKANLDEDKIEKCMQTFMEGFLLFSFSEYRCPYPEDDCEWFYHLANKQTSFIHKENMDFWSKCASFGVFHLILSRILGFPLKNQSVHLNSLTNQQSTVDFSSNVINLFNDKKRSRVGEVLLFGKNYEDVTPFVPALYTKVDENLPSSQPLAELYFSVVLKCLKQKGCKEFYLIRLAKELLKNTGCSEQERYLCQIEKEAVVHALLESVSTNLDPRYPEKAHEIIRRKLHVDIEAIISNEPKIVINTTAEVPACLFTLAYNLQCQAKSSVWLMEQLKNDTSGVIQVFPTIEPLNVLIQLKPSEDMHSQMLFVSEMSDTDLSTLYTKTEATLEEIHITQAKTAEEKLIRLIESYCTSPNASIYCGDIRFNVICAFQMILWNCIYYNFYIKKRSSQAISEALCELRPHYLEDCVLALMQSFVCPQNMYKRLETTFFGRGDEPRYRLTSRLEFEAIKPDGEKRDPLHEFFNPENPGKDPSEVSLKHALANMIAATLACGRNSHLWYHMFESNELLETHMTGFMYDHKVTSAHKYDCGVELSQEGLHGRPDYKARADKHYLSLHSWYSILWANFGAFCVGLITQPDGHEKIGTVLSEHHSDIRHMCVAQMRNFWLHINLALNRTTEEISFFIRRAMTFLVKVCNTRQECGKFLTLESVSSYEEVWHNHVYTPSFKDVQTQSTFVANKLQQHLRMIGLYYPHFPSEMEFTQSLQSLISVCEHSTHSRLQILSKFTMEYPRLKAGAKLLPELIKLYNWIHRELKCLVDEGYAQDNGLEEIITKGNKMYPKHDLCGLYKRVTEGYNEYVECIGYHIGAGACANVKREGVIFHLTVDTKLIHMLSIDNKMSDEDDDEVSINGWLLLVIMDIIQHHNGFLNDIHADLQSDERYNQQFSIIDDDSNEVLPEEVKESDCIIGNSDRFLQLIRCRQLLSKGLLSQSQMLVFDYEKLQHDVIEEFILGKPKINDKVQKVRIPFKFRKPMAVAVGVGISEADVDILSNYLRDEFKSELNEEHKKELECQLHAADHNKLNEIAAGLLVSANHLVKCLNLPDGPVDADSIKDLDLHHFLMQLYKESSDTTDTILLENIGINSLTKTEQVCLIHLSMRSLFATLKYLVRQIQIGVYDFCHLPLAMKKQIDGCDEIIKKIHQAFNGTVCNDQLLREVEDLSNALIQSEMELHKNNKYCQEPLMPYITRLSLVDENDLLPQIIPNTVLGAHYVSLHMLLRRVTDHCKQQEIHHNRWDDFTPDLWAEGNLKYLRDIALPFDEGEFVYDPGEDCFGFQKDYQKNNMQEEDFIFYVDEDIGNTGEVIGTEGISEETNELTEPVVTITEPSQEILKEVAKDVTEEDVRKFLSQNQLEEYIDLFSKNGIDGDLLVELGERELMDLKVTNTFHQKKIIKKFKKYLISRL